MRKGSAGEKLSSLARKFLDQVGRSSAFLVLVLSYLLLISAISSIYEVSEGTLRLFYMITALFAVSFAVAFYGKVLRERKKGEERKVPLALRLEGSYNDLKNVWRKVLAGDKYYSSLMLSHIRRLALGEIRDRYGVYKVEESQVAKRALESGLARGELVRALLARNLKPSKDPAFWMKLMDEVEELVKVADKLGT